MCSHTTSIKTNNDGFATDAFNLEADNVRQAVAWRARPNSGDAADCHCCVDQAVGDRSESSRLFGSSSGIFLGCCAKPKREQNCFE